MLTSLVQNEKEYCIKEKRYQYITIGSIYVSLTNCSILYLKYNIYEYDDSFQAFFEKGIMILSIYLSYVLIKDYFNDVKKSEDDYKNNIRKVKLLAYTRILIFVVNLVPFYILLFDNYFFTISNFLYIDNSINFSVLMFILYLGILLILYSSANVYNVDEKDKKKKIFLTYTLFVTSCIFHVLSIYYLHMPLVYSGGITGVFSVFAIIGSAFFIAIGYINNICLIRGYGYDENSIIVSLIFFFTYLIIFTIYSFSSNFGEIIFDYRIFLNLIYFASLILLPYVVAICFKKDNLLKENNVCSNSPEGGVIQDCLLSIILFFFSCILTRVIYLYAIEKSFIFAVSAIVGYTGSILIFLGYCLKNNIEHFRKAKKNFENCKDDFSNVKGVKRKQLRGLYKHIWFQNSFIIVITLCYSFIFMFLLLIIYIIKQKDIYDMIETYLPSYQETK
ncbi:MAG: hypothetical protein ACK5LV_04900 [Lachnospirales bacterium]